jgi:spermidine/putrescine transport system substrate-binding protein
MHLDLVPVVSRPVEQRPEGRRVMTDKSWMGRGVSRRSFLKTSAAVGLGAVASPAIVSNAFSSSGELNFMGWSGYPGYQDEFAAFNKKTGIKVNFLEQPDQDSMLAQCRLALQTGGVDAVEPTVERLGAWNSNGIVQPWDLAKLDMAGYDTAFVTGAAGDLAQIDGKRFFVPAVWGTEALTFSTTDNPMEYGKASLADLFDPKFEGKVTVRAHSSLAAMGRVLDAQGKLPKPWIESYKDEATMRQLWDIALAEAIKHKANVVQFWNGENDAQAAFKTNGCTLGLTWDSTGFNLSKDGGPYGFIAPKEGAFAWLQGFFLMKNAKNVEQAHEWAKYLATPEGSAMHAKTFSANPTAKGAIDLGDPVVVKFYKSSYPGDALQKLYWWPPQVAWFIKLRGEYADKWKAA